MAKNSAIEWTDHTWNPWRGCLKVSPGCKYCYMYRQQERYGGDPRTVTRAKPATFYQPLKWRKPALVFTCSWSDFFIDEADEWRAEAWDIIRQTPHLTYQILTKRPERVMDSLPADWGEGWPNVWLGVSVETEAYYWRLDELARVPAAIRFISYEPALGPVSFASWLSDGSLNWVISGGESGYQPRPADIDWFRDVRDESLRYGVPYFHKQHGGRQKSSGAWGGRLLDGQEWSQYPEAQPVWAQGRLF